MRDCLQKGVINYAESYKTSEKRKRGAPGWPQSCPWLMESRASSFSTLQLGLSPSRSEMRSGFKKIPLQQGQRKREWAGSLANRLWAWTTHSALWASVTRVGTIEASRLVWGLESGHSPEGSLLSKGKFWSTLLQTHQALSPPPCLKEFRNRGQHNIKTPSLECANNHGTWGKLHPSMSLSVLYL